MERSFVCGDASHAASLCLPLLFVCRSASCAAALRVPRRFVCRSASYRKAGKLFGERAALTHRLEQSHAGGHGHIEATHAARHGNGDQIVTGLTG